MDSLVTAASPSPLREYGLRLFTKARPATSQAGNLRPTPREDDARGVEASKSLRRAVENTDLLQAIANLVTDKLQSRVLHVLQ